VRIIVENWRNFVKEGDMEEDVDPQTIDLSSFQVKDSLQPDFWSDDRLDPDVRERLLEIANDFIDSLGFPNMQILDITLTGSIANFNWSEFSDIDLHILVDYDQIGEKPELISDLLTAKRVNWNRKHKIMVKDHEVELYFQDVKEPHASTGVYSVLDDKWLEKPEKEDPEIDYDNIRIKAAAIMDIVDNIEVFYLNEKFKEAHDFVVKTKEKLRNFRKAGLETGGEYSIENLAFKVLRRNGYLEKLSNLQDLAYDAMLSLQEES